MPLHSVVLERTPFLPRGFDRMLIVFQGLVWLWPLAVSTFYLAAQSREFDLEFLVLFRNLLSLDPLSQLLHLFRGHGCPDLRIDAKSISDQRSSLFKDLYLHHTAGNSLNFIVGQILIYTGRLALNIGPRFLQCRLLGFL